MSANTTGGEQDAIWSAFVRTVIGSFPHLEKFAMRGSLRWSNAVIIEAIRCVLANYQTEGPKNFVLHLESAENIKEMMRHLTRIEHGISAQIVITNNIYQCKIGDLWIKMELD